MRAISTAFDNQDYKIRVIIHTGTLKGFDVVNNYAEKIWNFRSLWTSQITKMAYAFFNNEKSIEHYEPTLAEFVILNVKYLFL